MRVNALWDLDGTLFDTYPTMIAATQAVLAEHGLKRSQSELLLASKRDSIRAIMLDASERLNVPVEELLADFHHRDAVTAFDAKPYPEARAALQGVVDQGGLNLLLTHRDHSAWELLDQAGMRDLFLGGVTADLELARKPAPDSILWLLDRFQLNPERSVMIGDRALDVQAGINAGVQTIYFDVDGLGDAPQATISVNNLAEIPAYFGQEN